MTSLHQLYHISLLISVLTFLLSSHISSQTLYPNPNRLRPNLPQVRTSKSFIFLVVYISLGFEVIVLLSCNLTILPFTTHCTYTKHTPSRNLHAVGRDRSHISTHTMLCTLPIAVLSSANEMIINLQIWAVNEFAGADGAVADSTRLLPAPLPWFGDRAQHQRFPRHPACLAQWRQCKPSFRPAAGALWNVIYLI